jgi:hypothetical protein
MARDKRNLHQYVWGIEPSLTVSVSCEFGPRGRTLAFGSSMTIMSRPVLEQIVATPDQISVSATAFSAATHCDVRGQETANAGVGVMIVNRNRALDLGLDQVRRACDMLSSPQGRRPREQLAAVHNRLLVRKLEWSGSVCLGF